MVLLDKDVESLRCWHFQFESKSETHKIEIQVEGGFVRFFFSISFSFYIVPPFTRERARKISSRNKLRVVLRNLRALE